MLLSELLLLGLIGAAFGRVRPINPVPGGITEMTKEEIAKDADLKRAVNFAVARFNEKINGRFIVIRIIRAWRSVVAGIKYKAIVRIGARHLHRTCTFTVVHQAWMPVGKKFQYLGVKCPRLFDRK